MFVSSIEDHNSRLISQKVCINEKETVKSDIVCHVMKLLKSNSLRSKAYVQSPQTTHTLIIVFIPSTDSFADTLCQLNSNYQINSRLTFSFYTNN